MDSKISIQKFRTTGYVMLDAGSHPITRLQKFKVDMKIICRGKTEIWERAYLASKILPI